MRLFIAIPVPCTPAIRSVLKRIREMGTALRAVDPGQLHITVKFLGEVAGDRLPSVKQLIQSIQGVPIDPLQLSGLGAFPRVERPEVIWAGIDENPSLIRLNLTLEQSASLIGFPRESRKFTPHLTLARVKRKPPDSLIGLLANSTKIPLGSADQLKVTLYRSDLRPTGPVYTQLSE